MRHLPQAYANEYDKSIMRELRCKISWGVVNTEAQQTNTPSSNDIAPFSYINVPILHNKIIPEAQFATFEPYLFDLSGSMALIPANLEQNEIGYVSNSLCDAEGYFETPPILHFDFTSPINIYGVLLNFSFYFQEYPVVFDVIGTKEDTSTLEVKITDNHSYSLPLSLNFEEIVALDIVFRKWCKGRRRARLVEIEFGLYRFYDNSTLINAEEKRMIDQTSSSLPIPSFTFTVLDKEEIFNRDNTQGISQYLTQRQPIKVTYYQVTDDGEIEIDGGTYYLKEWNDTDKRFEYRLTAEDLIGFMDDPYYGGKYYPNGAQVSVVMEDLLNSAFPFETGLNGHWDLSQAPNVLVYAPLPIKVNNDYISHKDCLSILAQLAGCYVITDSDGKIVVKPLEYSTEDYTIALSKIYGNPPKSRLKSILKQVDCVYRQVSTISETKNTVYLLDGLEAVPNRSYICEYDLSANSFVVNDDAEVYINNVLISNTPHTAEIGAYAAKIQFATAGTYKVEIKGKVAKSYATTLTVHGTHPNYMNGETITVNNPIVTTKEQAETICNRLIYELQVRDYYELNMKRDLRLEVGDVIKLEKALLSSDMPLAPRNVRVLEINRSLTSAQQKIRLREVKTIE